MEIYSSPKAYVFNLHTTSSSEARRLWRRKIKERWDYECAYCGSEEDLTIDHVVPRSKGGMDIPENMGCCCDSCNHLVHSRFILSSQSSFFFTQRIYNESKD